MYVCLQKCLNRCIRCTGFVHTLSAVCAPSLLLVCVPQVTGEATILFLQVLFLMFRLDGKVRWWICF